MLNCQRWPIKKTSKQDSSVTNNHASIGDQFPTIRFVPKHTRMSLVAETPEGMYREGLKAFKYLSSKYAPGLLLNGSTRIGTLHDYRREELGRGIYDPNEGRKRLHHRKTHFTVTAGTPEGDSMKHMGFDLAGDAKLKVDGIKWFERSIIRTCMSGVAPAPSTPRFQQAWRAQKFALRWLTWAASFER